MKTNKQTNKRRVKGITRYFLFLVIAFILIECSDSLNDITEKKSSYKVQLSTITKKEVLTYLNIEKKFNFRKR